MTSMLEDLSQIDSMEEGETPLPTDAALSPASGAENLFLAGLMTSHISARELATRLRTGNTIPSGASIKSALSEDFQSCVENTDDFLLADADEEDSTFYSVATKPKPIKETEEETPELTSRSMPAVVQQSAPAQPAAPEDHPDAAENIYAKVKDVWVWGKGLPLISIGLGITEAVVGKAANVAGTDLEEIDSKVKPHLAHLDEALLNPAIEAVVEAVLGAAGKTEEVMKPIVIQILSPFGLIKNEAENPEVERK